MKLLFFNLLQRRYLIHTAFVVFIINIILCHLSSFIFLMLIVFAPVLSNLTSEV